jgi:hypothetical protein
MPNLRMRDFLTVKVKGAENKKYLFECKDSTSETGHSLYTVVEATHSGIVNGNMRFYRPDRMQDGCHTWTSGTYPRPVLVRHDEDVDPMGRVAKARYLDFSHNYDTKYPNVRKLMFYDSSRNRLNLFDSVDWVMKNLNRLPDYRGLGAIELGMNVTHPEAIEKVMRDEYMTVSVGFQTDSAICSVCHTDWAEDDKCEHKLGQVYDGKKMFLISGAMKFDEVSFVNFPADPFAVIKTKGEAIKAVQDSLATRVFFLGLSSAEQFKVACADELEDLEINYHSDIIPVTGDPRSEDSMKDIIAEIKSPELTRDRAFAIKESLQNMAPTETVDKRQVTRALNNINAIIRQNDWNEPIDTPESVQAEIDSLPKDATTEQIEALKVKASAVGIEFVFTEDDGSADQTDATPAEGSGTNVTDAVAQTDGKSEKALSKCLADLENIFNALEEKYELFDALDALMRKLSADSYYSYVKKKLEETDEYKTLQLELDTLHNSAEKAEQEIVALKRTRDALVQSNSILTSAQKKTLATSITLLNALRKDSMPSAEEIQKEIERKATRHLVSLQDALDDLVEDLPMIVTDGLTVATTVEEKPPTEAPVETEKVEDAAVTASEVDDAAAVTELTESDPVNAEEQTDQAALDNSVTPMLSQRELRRLAALKRYQSLN